MDRSTRRRARSAPLLLAVALALAFAPLARAASDTPPPDDSTGGRRLIRYVLCAVGIATAATGVGAVTAVLSCTLSFLQEPPAPGGA